MAINYNGLSRVQWTAYFWFHCITSRDVHAEDSYPWLNWNEAVNSRIYSECQNTDSSLSINLLGIRRNQLYNKLHHLLVKTPKMVSRSNKIPCTSKSSWHLDTNSRFSKEDHRLFILSSLHLGVSSFSLAPTSQPTVITGSAMPNRRGLWFCDFRRQWNFLFLLTRKYFWSFSLSISSWSQKIILVH